MSTTNIFEKSVALSLEIGKIGTRKKVQSSRMELKDSTDQPEPEAISVSKELIDCPEYDAISSYDNAFRTAITALTLPSPFRKGIYLIPVQLIEKVDKMIEQYKQQRTGLIEKFVQVYNQTVLNAREKLGGLWNPQDYLALDCVKAAFTVQIQYLDLGLPKNLGTTSPEIFERERKAFEEKLTSASDEIQQAMRQSFSDLVAHMADRLKPGEDGKPKIFRDTLVLNLKEFMENFSARNITNDDQLDKLVSQAKEILRGKSPQALRDSGLYRKEVAEKMDEIKTQLSGMITTAPVRKFSLED